MSNPRLEQFAIDLPQEVLAKAGIDAASAGETNQPLREEAFTEYVVGLLDEHNEANGEGNRDEGKENDRRDRR